MRVQDLELVKRLEDHASERPADGPSRNGHPHFWERAISRRSLMKTAAGSAVVVLSSGLWMPVLSGRGKLPGAGLVSAHSSQDTDVPPRPIPAGIELAGVLFHVFLPGPGSEPSTITDFNGLVGLTEIHGTGTGTANGGTSSFPFSADLRFMQGTYIGIDDRPHRGTFAFI